MSMYRKCILYLHWKCLAINILRVLAGQTGARHPSILFIYSPWIYLLDNRRVAASRHAGNIISPISRLFIHTNQISFIIYYLFKCSKRKRNFLFYFIGRCSSSLALSSQIVVIEQNAWKWVDINMHKRCTGPCTHDKWNHIS